MHNLKEILINVSREISVREKAWNCKVFVLVSQSLSASPLPSWFPPQIKYTVSKCREINIGSSQVCFSSHAWWENASQFSSFSKWAFRGLFTRLWISGKLFPAALVVRHKINLYPFFGFGFAAYIYYEQILRGMFFLYGAGFVWFFNSLELYSDCYRQPF